MRSGNPRDGNRSCSRRDDLPDALFAHEVVLSAAHVEDRKPAAGKVLGHVYLERAARATGQNLVWHSGHRISNLIHE